MNLVKGVVTPQNHKHICRVCLQSNTQSYDIDSLLEFNDFGGPALNITEILNKVTNQTLAPQGLICHGCLIELKCAYLFVVKFEQASTLLQEFLTSQIKTEEPPQSPDNTLGRGKKRVRKKSHSEEDFKESKLHLCPICFQEFTALKLRDHARTHKALKNYLSIPEKYQVTSTTKFSTTRHLTNPKVTFLREEKVTHECPHCNLDFTIEDYRAHVETHREQKEYKCNKCQRVFKRINHLNTHKLKHMKEYPYNCEHCGKKFVIKSNYDCHVLKHSKAELPHECKFCLKRFYNPEHLTRHLLVHTENVTYSVKYRVCRCQNCLRSFTDKEEYNAHVCVPVKRTTNATYPCKACNKVFLKPGGLYNHKRNVHQLKGSKILCSVCGKYVSNIYVHMMRHKGVKPFPCDQCEKSFISRRLLSQHLLVHSGVKPYVCSCCGKAFNNLYNLQVHERIHRGVKNHICHVCGKGFLEKSYLRKHMHVHSKNGSDV